MPRKPASRRASLSPSITLGGSMNPNVSTNRVIPTPTGTNLTRWSGPTRRIGADDVDQQHTLVQDPIVAQVMGQGERDAGACRGEDRSRSRQANWRGRQEPDDELLLRLAQSPAPLFEG